MLICLCKQSALCLNTFIFRVSLVEVTGFLRKMVAYTMNSMLTILDGYVDLVNNISCFMLVVNLYVPDRSLCGGTNDRPIFATFTYPVIIFFQSACLC